jgi:hypothetical protein
MGRRCGAVCHQKGKEKAKKRGITVNFLVGDALKPQLLQNKFDTIIDCGLFHVFSDEERPIFAANLSSVLLSWRQVPHALFQRA